MKSLSKSQDGSRSFTTESEKPIARFWGEVFLGAKYRRTVLEYYSFPISASTHRQGLQTASECGDLEFPPLSRRLPLPSDTQSHVLCVDDDVDACEMLVVLMSSYGIDVSCAGSAAEAWLKMKAESFDLYMLDGWLPQVDGFELCRQIRECDSVTPILFYSGAAYDVDKQKGIAAGANAYLTKPDVENLIDTIVDLIAKAKAARVAAGRVVNRSRQAAHMFSHQSLSTEAATS